MLNRRHHLFVAGILLFLLATMALGALFLVIKGFEYEHKFAEHHVPGPTFQFDAQYARPAQIFFSLYFVMTGLHAAHMVGDIAEMRLHRRVNGNDLRMREPLRHFEQGGDGVAQAQEVAAQEIKAVNIGMLHHLVEDRIFDRFHLVVDRLQHRRIIVDDEIEDSVEDVFLAM